MTTIKARVFVRSPYNYDTADASKASALVCPEPTRTQQHQAEEADINTIVRRFGVTGRLPSVAMPPTYGDFDIGVHDYRSALELVESANASFMGLSADVRARFNNDPAAFVSFCSLSSNLAEMRKMGLAVPLPTDPLDGTVVDRKDS